MEIEVERKPTREEERKKYLSSKRPKTDKPISQWRSKLKLEGAQPSPGSIQATRTTIQNINLPTKQNNGDFSIFTSSSNKLFQIKVKRRIFKCLSGRFKICF